jgi:hypothetical protein
MPGTYYVVVLFDRDGEVKLPPSEPRELQSADAAARAARSTVIGHSGAVAFSRTGDPVTGEFEYAVILAQYGEVDFDALSV